MDRSDPSNFITLQRIPMEYRGMELVFTEVELISSDDESYDYQIADGYVGVVIEVREENELIGELRLGCYDSIRPHKLYLGLKLIG